MARKLSDRERQKAKKNEFIITVSAIMGFCLYFGLILGHAAKKTPDGDLFETIDYLMSNSPKSFFMLFPTKLLPVLIFLLIGGIICAVIWEEYNRKKGVVDDPNGDAAFMEDYRYYDQRFVIDPDIAKKLIPEKKYKTITEEYPEHKKIVKSPRIKSSIEKDPVYKACWMNTQLYADKVALSLNGSWAQRNSNAMIFGASGSGKSRYFLNPNLLQANSNYVVTDPSGEIMLGYGAFLEKEEGYIVKCLNISDMQHSCRFNPLQYIHSADDIPVIVTTLMENTQKKEGGGGGDGDFWTKTTQALLCCIIGYLFEVEPLERRNFYNVLEMLRMASEDEDASDGEPTDFDRMFEVLGKKNPNSYAFHQYQTYSLAPRKTALNILISTAVLLSTYVDIKEFNNLTFKDEMELEKFGSAPFKLRAGEELYFDDKARYEARYESGKLERGYIDVEDFKKYESKIERDELGRYKEGKPYKMAIFLCIPTADTTYNWLTAMLYSIVFKLVYRRGETRAKQQVMSNPKLAFPARFLIDECANIGKIPNLQEYLATCRKYMISIVPIFQSFSQIIKVYGKEDANSIYANCDTTLFLGGVDSDTLKIVCDRLGKESVKSMSTGLSGSQKNKSASQNIQSVGRELMSRIQVEQMANAECLVFIRAIKPFKVHKFTLQNHPNYKYTAEADATGHSYVNPFCNEVSAETDDEVESLRIKKVGEAGYNEPEEVDSARLRASKATASEARKDAALSLQNAAPTYGVFDESLYSDEKEKKTAREGHEAYIKALSDTYRDAEKENDSQVMDIIAQTCIQYRIDIGVKFDDIQEDPHRKSPEDVRDMRMRREVIRPRTLSPEETAEVINSADVNKMTLVTSYDPLAEFEIPSKERIAQKFGEMLRKAQGLDIEEDPSEYEPKVEEVEDDDLEPDESEYIPTEVKGVTEELSLEDFIPMEDDEVLDLDEETQTDFSNVDESEFMDSYESEDYDATLIVSSEETESSIGQDTNIFDAPSFEETSAEEPTNTVDESVSNQEDTTDELIDVDFGEETPEEEPAEDTPSETEFDSSDESEEETSFTAEDEEFEENTENVPEENEDPTQRLTLGKITEKYALKEELPVEEQTFEEPVETSDEQEAVESDEKTEQVADEELSDEGSEPETESEEETEFESTEDTEESTPVVIEQQESPVNTESEAHKEAEEETLPSENETVETVEEPKQDEPQTVHNKRKKFKKRKWETEDDDVIFY